MRYDVRAVGTTLEVTQVPTGTQTMTQSAPFTASAAVAWTD